MSLMTNEIPSDNETLVINESNKRKFDEIEVIVKKCKITPTASESPTTSPFASDDQSNAILTDDTDNESTDSTDRIEKPIAFTATPANNTISNQTDASESKSEQCAETIVCPKYGQIVDRRVFRRAGPYIIGLKLGHSPVDSIVQYLAKKENTNEFVQLKILMLNNNTTNEKLQRDERQGKMLLHTEYSLLSLLQGERGVSQQHGMFSDMAYEEVIAENGTNNNYFTGALRKRLILVLDCTTAHDFDPLSSAYVNLQQYLINRRKLTEMEALSIFCEIVTVVESLHKRNIIHRDLKLGNIVLNKHTNKITITNFCLGKYLLNENDLLFDQRGSPAYISPDVLCGKPYKGKPSDMWALGVVLFMLLYRQFPFFESTPTALFKKIKSAEYFIPMNCEISKATEQIIKGLLQLNPEKRLTATQVRVQLKAIIDASLNVRTTDHLVPEIDINNDDLNHSIMTTEMPFKEKWKKIIPQNTNDQVVPSMSSTSTTAAASAGTTNPVPAPGSRKRRRSTEKLLNDFTQRGISVQHVGSDARQLNANDIGQLQHLFRSNRNRIGNLSFRETIRPANGSSAGSNAHENNTSAMSTVLRLFPNIRLRNGHSSATDRLNRNGVTSNGIPFSVERNGQQLPNSNLQLLRFGNTTLNDLFRCAITSNRNQQASAVNRLQDHIRLIRRIRRTRLSTNNQGSR